MQSKTQSLVEACANVLVGYLVALASQLLVFPLFGIHVPFSSNLAIALDAARWRAMRQQFAGVDFGDRDLAPLVALFKTEVTTIMVTPSGADKIADAAVQSPKGGA